MLMDMTVVGDKFFFNDVSQERWSLSTVGERRRRGHEGAEDAQPAIGGEG
jgi:hypothetical protein